MKWGILFRWSSFWVGAHWSSHNKRLCVNLLPFITFWITMQGGETPYKPTQKLMLVDDPDRINQARNRREKSDIPFNVGSEVWIEAGNDPTRAAELRISLSEGVPTGHGDFWIPICSPSGEPMGWMRFGFITTMRGATVFGATEWRPASEPAPAEQTMLPLPVNHVPEGFAPPL